MLFPRQCLQSINYQDEGDFWVGFFTVSRATNG